MIPIERKREFYFSWFLAIGLAIGVIWVRIKTVKQTYVFVQKEKQAHVLQSEIQTLRMNWGQLTAPKRLRDLASRMELHPPERHQILEYEGK